MSDFTANGFAQSAAREATDPPRKRATGPLFMGDALMSWGGEPVFLRDWRQQQDDQRAETARKAPFRRD